MWIGGSIVASFDTYRHLRVTREEWEEGGADYSNLLSKHCL